MSRRLFARMNLLFFLLSLLYSLPVPASAAGAPADTSISVVDGVADFRHLDLSDQRQIIPLHGEWDFYWKQLLTPDSLKQQTAEPLRLYVPSSWKHASSLAGTEKQGYGYGTYRLLMHVPEKDVGRNKALFMRSIGSAYRIWVDGQELSGLGQVGTERKQEHPQSHIHIVFFQPSQETVEIVIQVSNFSFREGGIMDEVDYGDTSALIPYILRELLVDVCVIGGFAFIGLYHLIVFSMRRRDTATLLVGLLSLSVALRSLFISGYLSSMMLGINSWELLVKLEYSAELAAFTCGIFLMRSLFPQEAHRFMLRLGTALAGGMQLFVLLSPARIFTETMLIQTVLKAVILLYFIVYVGVRAYIRRREGAFIHVLALGIIVLALLNDMLYYLRLVQTVELFSYSIVPFILAQATIVSYRYTRLSQRNDQLVEELEEANAYLEEKVNERTHSLQAAQELRTKMLVNIAHDLGTPIVGIQTYIHLLVEGRAQMNQGAMTRQLLDKTAYIKRLVHDLFELSKLESKELLFHIEEIEAQSWLEEMHALFAEDLSQKGFKLQNEWQGSEISGIIRIDRIRMLQVLHNYMDNAVKFSGEFSKVIVLKAYMEQASDPSSDRRLIVEVTDFGIGITENDQDHVFQRFYKRRERNEEGSGLGLAIVKEIVEQHHGEAGVRSSKGEGSTFVLKLPATVQE